MSFLFDEAWLYNISSIKPILPISENAYMNYKILIWTAETTIKLCKQARTETKIKQHKSLMHQKNTQ